MGALVWTRTHDAGRIGLPKDGGGGGDNVEPKNGKGGSADNVDNGGGGGVPYDQLTCNRAGMRWQQSPMGGWECVARAATPTSQETCEAAGMEWRPVPGICVTKATGDDGPTEEAGGGSGGTTSKSSSMGPLLVVAAFAAVAIFIATR